MARLKKINAKKTTPQKEAPPRVKTKKIAVSKRVATKNATDYKPVIKKGGKLVCQDCGFAITVDSICSSLDEFDKVHLICCVKPTKLKSPTAIK